MIAGIVIVVVVSVLIVLVCSQHNWAASVFVVVGGSFAVALAVGMICDALSIPRHAWQAPIVLNAPLPVLGTLGAWAGRDCEPITLTDIVKVINDISTQRRRRSSIKADVRRRVNQYKVEVS